MKSDILNEWNPLSLNSKQVFFDSLIHDSGLHVKLIENGTEAIINVFFRFHLAFRSTDEGYLLNLWVDQKESLGKVFYIIENSTFIEQLKKSSMGLQPALDMAKHYAIFCQDECIEIVSTESPSVFRS